jgi:hypothetical protein
MGNEQSKKPEPLPQITRRDYHAPFPPKRKIDYKDPRNLVLPKGLPVKVLRPVKKRFQPIPGIPEEEENEEFTDTEIDRNSNLGSIQNLNFIGLIDKENSDPNGLLGNGVLLNGHAPMIGNGELQGKQKKKNPAPPPPLPPPVPGTNAPLPPPAPVLSSRRNSTPSLTSQAQSQTPNQSADDKTKKISGTGNVRRFSADMKGELIDQVRARMKRPPKKHVPIEKPKTSLEIFQSELASVSARMEEKRASKQDWNVFEKKYPIVIDVGHKAANKTKDDTTLGAEVQILSLNNPPNGRMFRKKDGVMHARSEDWVPEHDLKSFEENKDADHPILANLSTDDEVMYRSGLQFKAKEPSLASARHYRSGYAEGEDRRPQPEKHEERKSSNSKYSNSLRAFKRNMQQMFNSLGKSSVSSKERGSVLDLFEDQAKLDDLEDELAAMEDIDEEEIDLRQQRRVTFSQNPAQTREVVYYPGDSYHRRFSADGYYPPMYARRPPRPFDPWYDEAMRYIPPPPYRFVEGPVMYPTPDRRLLEMDYYRQMEDFHYYNPNSPNGMFYGRHGAGAATTPPTEKKKGKLSLRSRRRKLIEEARLKRQLAEEILIRDLRERQRMKNDKIQKKEYNANWEMLRDDIQYDSGLVSSRIRPNNHSQDRIHQRRRSAPAASQNSVDSYWEMYDGDGGVRLEGHARNVNFPDRTGCNEFEVREFNYVDKEAGDERLQGAKDLDDVTASKNSRRRGHAQKQRGDVMSSSSDENKPHPKVLKSVLDEFDDIINSVHRDYSSSEDEAGGEGGLGSLVKTINTTKEKHGTKREHTKKDINRR